jgi:hypothetical protein
MSGFEMGHGIQDKAIKSRAPDQINACRSEDRCVGVFCCFSSGAFRNGLPKVRLGSTPVIENREPYFRFGSKAEIQTETLPENVVALPKGKTR